jgi:GNAT superfamily N-acetyltransferase
MATLASPRALSDSDDRKSFDCGRGQVNAWFRRHGWANHVGGASRVSVISDPSGGRVIRFVTLSASQIERAFLPKSEQRNTPDPAPVLLLGQLAVDRDYQSKDYATALLLFAFRSALQAAEIIGCIGLITHPLDDGVRQFYARRGFRDLAFDPKRAMMIRMADLRHSFEN